ncbi:MAG: hypothetical protein ACOYET_03595 [Bacillota bacterium]
MRRSVNIRIVAFVLLLGMIGVIAAGCTVTVTFYWTFPRYELDAFFRNFAAAIGQENADFVSGFYEDWVYVKPEGEPVELVSRCIIADRWLEHFRKYYIEESNILEIEERRPYEDKHAVVKVKRSEVVWDLIGFERAKLRLYQEEKYYLWKGDAGWRIYRMEVIRSERIELP